MNGYWSRRINDEHRLVYKIIGTDGSRELVIFQCATHYEQSPLPRFASRSNSSIRPRKATAVGDVDSNEKTRSCV